ncbi:hypothetical protein BN7874_217 [Phage NCTB]|nr:hypothetical protein BN7874_217 [Phage NCTB]
MLPEFNPKHFVMVQAPYDFTLKFNDHTLSNNLELDIKRMFCFAGKFEGRLTIESEIEQTIRLTYA